MSKKAVASMVVVVLFLAALSQAVLAQQGPAGGPGGPAMHEMMGKEITPEQFPEVKAKVLKMIDERRTRLDKEKACVEAATNGAELKKCRPERPMGGLGGGMQGGPGQQRPSRPAGEQKQ